MNRYLINPDAEQAVIGACLIDAQAYWRVQETGICADHFANLQCRQIWEAIDGMANKKIKCDVITICDYNPNIDLPTVVEIASNTPGSSNVMAYADLVVKSATARNVLNAGQRIAKLEMPGDEAANEALTIMQSIAIQTRGETTTLAAGASRFLVELQERWNTGEQLTGVPTGITQLDAKIGGLEPGLIIVAARPSMGKSAISLQIALSASVERQERVFFASLEMDSTQLAKRAASHLSGIAMGKFRTPKELTNEDWPKLTATMATCKKSPLIISDRSGQTAVQIAALIRQAYAVGGLSMAIVDYLGLIRMPGKPGDIRHDYGAACKTLRAVGRDLQIPVILLAQLNRGLEGRPSKRPQMSDLRESGEIEQDADVIIFVHREDYYGDGGPSSEGIAELIVAKHRQGETGTVPTYWRPKIQKFETYSGPWPIKPPDDNKPKKSPYSNYKKGGNQ